MARSGNVGSFGGGIFQPFVQALTTRRNPAAYLLLTLLCLIAFGTGLADLPPTDRDESRFMQATKQMIESGDYIHIRVQNEPRRKKPVGIHWLQAAAVQALGQPLTSAWPYRIPSALGAWAAVLLVCATGRRLFGTRAGLIAGAATATFPLVIAEAHLAKTDGAMLGFITLAMTALARVYVPSPDVASGATPHHEETWPVVVFWMAVGAAILIKGPVVLLIVGATIATLCAVDQSTAILTALRPWWGIPLAVLIVAPWFLTLAAGGDSDFISAAVRDDLLPKLMGGQESHGAPPGSHLVATLLTTWPWSLMLPPALIAVWPHRHSPAVRYCLAWLVPGWLAFEAIPTKLPHYVLPLLPAAALLLGAATEDLSRLQAFLRRPGGMAWRGFWALVSVGLGVAILWLSLRYGADAGVATNPFAANPWATATAAGVVAAAIVAIFAGDRFGSGLAVTIVTVFAVWFGGMMMARVVPALDRLWVSRRLAAAVALHPAPGPVALVGFHEPSAIFLLGTTTHLTDVAGASADLIARPGTIAAVDAPDLAAVTTSIEAAGYKVIPLETIEGQNYARGMPIRLTLLTTARP